MAEVKVARNAMNVPVELIHCRGNVCAGHNMLS